MNHIMLDIETLDVRPTAVVLSIGAVKIIDGQLIDKFYRKLDIEAQLEVERTISADTLKWWATQNSAVFGEALDGSEGVTSSLEALYDFINDAPACVWGNGVAMDNVIITDISRDFIGEPTWSFRYDRCYRTLRGTPLFKKFLQNTSPIAFDGDAHNALHDAIYQANVLINFDTWLRDTFDPDAGVLE